MMRRPPKSPLFPSTPLFRSQGRRARRDVAAVEPRDRHPQPEEEAEPRQHEAEDVEEDERVEVADHVLLAQPPEEALHEQDRKSTRLNSSHANISYAVFCLKK